MTQRDQSSELESSLGRLAGILISEEDVASTVQKIAEFALAAIDGADFVGISLVSEDNVIRTVGRTHDVVAEVDEIQYDISEGPCLSTIHEQATFAADDLETDERWPRFARAAAQRGIRSLLTFVLEVSEESLAALNVYAREPNAFGPEDRRVGLIFANHAAITLANARTHEHDAERADQLQVGMASRQVIGEAVGILMERERLTSDEAFEVLKRLSQNLNVKLRDVAQRVVTEADDRGAG